MRLVFMIVAGILFALARTDHKNQKSSKTTFLILSSMVFIFQETGHPTCSTINLNSQHLDLFLYRRLSGDGFTYPTFNTFWSQTYSVQCEGFGWVGMLKPRLFELDEFLTTEIHWISYIIYIESWTISTSFPNLSCLKTASVFFQGQRGVSFSDPAKLARCHASSQIFTPLQRIQWLVHWAMQRGYGYSQKIHMYLGKLARDLTRLKAPKRQLRKGNPLISRNLGWWNIMIWPDVSWNFPLMIFPRTSSQLYMGLHA